MSEYEKWREGMEALLGVNLDRKRRLEEYNPEPGPALRKCSHCGQEYNFYTEIHIHSDPPPNISVETNDKKDFWEE